jgi:hypothetical protein
MARLLVKEYNFESEEMADIKGKKTRKKRKM